MQKTINSLKMPKRNEVNLLFGISPWGQFPNDPNLLYFLTCRCLQIVWVLSSSSLISLNQSKISNPTWLPYLILISYAASWTKLSQYCIRQSITYSSLPLPVPVPFPLPFALVLLFLEKLPVLPFIRNCGISQSSVDGCATNSLNLWNFRTLP